MSHFLSLFSQAPSTSSWVHPIQRMLPDTGDLNLDSVYYAHYFIQNCFPKKCLSQISWLFCSCEAAKIHFSPCGHCLFKAMCPIWCSEGTLPSPGPSCLCKGRTSDMAEGPINTGRSPTSRRVGWEPECCASTWCNLQGGCSPHTSWLLRRALGVSPQPSPLLLCLSVNPTDSCLALICYSSAFV